MLVIRRVQPEDIFSVIRLAYDTLSERYNPLLFTTFFESFPKGFLIALKNNKVIGFIVSIPVDEASIKIMMLSVIRSYRRQGIGSLLVTHLLEEMKRQNVRIVELEVKTTNTSAISLYKKHGFCIIKRIDGFYQTNESAFVMRKNLEF
ncbi:MAG: GNAT family N-acetyltransferase [Thermoplasmatota archaeon]